MKSNIVLLIFTVLLSIAIITVQNRSHSKSSDKNHDDDQAINWCPNPKELLSQNIQKKKNLQKPSEKLKSGENPQSFRKAVKNVIMINKFIKHRPGIPKDLIERDLQNAIKITLKDGYGEEFAKMLKNDKSLPQSLDWVEQSPNCFKNLSEQNQGTCGSCFIFATVNYFSILRCLNSESKELIPLSTQDVLSCMKRDDGKNNCQGGSPKDVWDHLYENGVVTHSCKCYKNYDYGNTSTSAGSSFSMFINKHMGNEIEECNKKCNDPNLISDHFKPEVKEMLVTYRYPKTISFLLNHYGILLGSLYYNIKFKKLYENIENDKELNDLNSGKTQSQLLKELFPENNPKGDGHSVIIVGYKFKMDDRCKKELINEDKFADNCFYFKILNSWGKDFGNNGYAYIANTFIDSTRLMFAYEDKLQSFIKEHIKNKNIYSFSYNDKHGLKLEELLKHHLPQESKE